jgi:membrane-associated protein
MQNLHEFITSNLTSLPTLALNFFIFLLAYIESLPVVTLFFPGMMAALIIGGLTQTGGISPIIAINLIAIGSFLGDLTSLYCGPHLLKLPWFKKFVEHEKYQKHWHLFDKHIALILILGKVLPFVRSAPSLFAGARKISKAKYYLYTLIGSYLWSTIAILGGAFLGKIFGKFVIPAILVIFALIGMIPYVYKEIRLLLKKY